MLPDGKKLDSRAYKLIDLENVYPAFRLDRRTGFDTDDFEELKKEYDYRCASCGSEEGKEHLFRKGVKVGLSPENFIPRFAVSLSGR